MTPAWADLLLCVAVTALTGLGLGLVLLALSRRWMSLAIGGAPLVVLAAVGAGVAVGAQKMTIDEASVSQLNSILWTSASVALAVGGLLVFQLRRLDQARARGEAELRRAHEVDQTRRQMITWVSHDLRTPLAGIRAMAEALADGVVEDPVGYQRRIVAETDRTSQMVDDLLALTRLHAGLPTRRDPVSLSDLISDTLASLRPGAEQRRVAVIGEVTGDATVRADPSLLSRAVLNLAGNAVSYTRPDTTVDVTARRVGDQVVIAVTDQCGGLSEDELAHLFDAGWRGNEARTPDSSAGAPHGAGLGLAIVKAVAEAHGGTVGAESGDDGCRIWFSVAAGR